MAQDNTKLKSEVGALIDQITLLQADLDIANIALKTANATADAARKRLLDAKGLLNQKLLQGELLPED